MASFTLQSVADRFPEGTSVSAYFRSDQTLPQGGVPPGAPAGSPDDTAVVASNGSLAFTSLSDATRYLAYAEVSGEHRYIAFTTDEAAAGSGGGASEVSLDAGTLSALETTELGATTLAALENTSVAVTAVPADPFGANADAVVAAGAAGSIQAKLRRLTTDLAAVAASVAGATPAGTNNIGDVDVASIAAGTNAIGNVGLEPRTSGGTAVSKLISAASTNATSVKASAGQVFGWAIYNGNAAVRFLKLYNKASAPTVGTDVPVMVVPIPAGALANVAFPHGIAFAAGIAFALTTGVADSDTGAVAANELVVNLAYK